MSRQKMNDVIAEYRSPRYAWRAVRASLIGLVLGVAAGVGLTALLIEGGWR